jgi:hypothetical protein
MYYITTMQETIIANITTKQFFRYNKTSLDDVGYNKILLHLLTPPTKKCTVSHWSREDIIVFAPENTHMHVNRNYAELYQLDEIIKSQM